MRLSWPLPAILVWGLAWVCFAWLTRHRIGVDVSAGVASVIGIVASLLGRTWWRRLMIGLGFPLSLLLTQQAASLPGWAWLLPLLALLLIYPLNAWRDAPLFPTPRNALNDLPAHAMLKHDAIILDAGCGLGDGLKALHKCFPKAQLKGIESSWALTALCVLRCPWAMVRQGNIWKTDWSNFDMVYLFQRPESMPRAAAKAQAELKDGSWLVSLEFEAGDLQARAVFNTMQGKPVWVYRAPLQHNLVAHCRGVLNR